MGINEKYNAMVENYYKLILFAVFAVTIFMVYMTTGLGINATPYFLEPSHPSRLADQHLKATFTGSGENLMIATKTSHDSIYNPESLKDLHSFTIALEELSLTGEADITLIVDILGKIQTAGILTNELSKLKDRLEAITIIDMPTNIFSPVDGAMLERLFERASSHGLLNNVDEKKMQDLLVRVQPIKKVRSIVRIESVTSKDGELDIHPMMFSVPETTEGLDALKKEALSNPLLKNIIFSEDPKVINMLVELNIPQDDAPNMRRVYTEITALIERMELKDSYHLGGPPAIFSQTSETMETDSNKFFPIVFLIVMILLFLVFRNIRNMLLPVIVAVASVIWTMGTMSIFGVKQNIVSTMLPVFLIAIGVSDSIHFLAEYRTKSRQGIEKPSIPVIRVLFKPMLMTTITTIVGFLSLAYTPIRFIQEFGVFVAVGVFYAFVITMTLLPALLLWLKPEKAKTLNKSPSFSRLVDLNVSLVTNHAKSVWIGVFAILIIAFVGLSKLTIDNEMIGYFSPETRVYQDNEVFKKQLSGAGVIEFVITSNEVDYFKQGTSIEALNKVSEKLKAMPLVGGVYDLPAFMKLMNKALNDDNPEAYQLPEAAENIYSQYVFLYENSNGDEIYNVLSEDGKEARIIVFVKSDKTSVMDEISSTIRPVIESRLEGVTVTPAGFGEVLIATRDEIIYTQISSLALSFGFVFVLLLFLFRSPLYAVFGVTPLLLTVTINFSIMGWLGLYLDVGTAIVAPIAIGIGVDYAIYFVNSCRSQGDITAKSIRQTLSHLYPPIIINTLVQFCGFLVLTLSSHQALVNLGILVALTMLVTAIVTLIVLPSLLLLLSRLLNSSESKLEQKVSG